MPLDDLTIRNAKPAAKPSELFDEKGLFLVVTPTGSKLWRLKYRFAGKEKLLAFGAYPEVSLKQARLRRDDARAMLREDRDPAAERKAAKQRRALEAQNAFKPVALEFIDRMGKRWSEGHRAEAIRRLDLNIFPILGKRPVDQIEPPELLAVLRKIEARGAHSMAHSVRALCGQVFRYAISDGKCSRDAAADLKGALTPPAHKPMPAIPIEELPRLLSDMDSCEEAPACRDRQTRLGLQLIALTALRTKELRKGLWDQISWTDKQWNS